MTAGLPGWIDVSRPLHPDMETFPGDPGIAIELARSRAAGDPADVTRLDMGAHTGTHVDAPVHVVDGGGGVETLPLDALEGPALILAALGLRGLGVDQLSVGGPETHRVLFAAGVVVLEGLDLRAAPPGRYHLRCLPLLVPGADGAPARALVRPEQP